MTPGKEETLNYVLDMERQLAKLAKKNGLPHLAQLIDDLVKAAVPDLGAGMTIPAATHVAEELRKR